MTKRLLTLSAIVLGLAIQAGNASASAFRVTPVRVVFEKTGGSTLLSLVNESEETLRFQITAHDWSQDPSGQMGLQPTRDILFFPGLVTLDAGEERKVRLSVKAPQAEVERSYRIFFEELPPLTKGEAQSGAQVRILTKMGVPVFLAPQKLVEKATIANRGVEGGSLRFDVKNEGTIRFAVQGVKLRGLDAGGAALFEQHLDGWYVLAGTQRSYSYVIPPDVCSRLKVIEIAAQTDSLAEGAAAATRRVEVSPANCR